MIRIDHTETFGFEAAIRGMRKDTINALVELFSTIGVTKVQNKQGESYVATVSDENKSLNLGTYKTESDAHNAVIEHRLNRFFKNILKVEELKNVYPCVYHGYFVSPNGFVFDRFGNLLKGRIGKSGYVGTNIWKDGKAVYKSFHRMIAESILPNPDNLPFINHKDGNKRNNRLENLEWCTRAHNTKHAYDTGLEKKMCGEDHHAHKLNNDAVRDIRKNYVKGSKKLGAGYFSKKYCVDVTVIRDVANYKTWRHV